jgi:hypothetical protein
MGLGYPFDSRDKASSVFWIQIATEISNVSSATTIIRPWMDAEERQGGRVAILKLYSSLKDRRAHPGADNISTALKGGPFEPVLMTPQEILAGKLSSCSCIAFPGGSATKQSLSIGEAGREIVREFVASGGGYLGICAGGYLAASHYNSDMSLRLLRASCMMSNSNTPTGRLTREEKRKPQPWMRGKKHCNLKFTTRGRALIWAEEKIWEEEEEEQNLGEGVVSVRYCNGPILMQVGSECLYQADGTEEKAPGEEAQGSEALTTEFSGLCVSGNPTEENNASAESQYRDPAEPGQFEVLATFDTEVNSHGAVPGTMVGTPAIVCGNYGAGRVVCISPHPESTSENGNLANCAGKERISRIVPRAVALAVYGAQQPAAGV